MCNVDLHYYNPDKAGKVCDCSSIHHSQEEKYWLELVPYFIGMFP